MADFVNFDELFEKQQTQVVINDENVCNIEREREREKEKKLVNIYQFQKNKFVLVGQFFEELGIPEVKIADFNFGSHKLEIYQICHDQKFVEKQTTCPEPITIIEMRIEKKNKIKYVYVPETKKYMSCLEEEKDKKELIPLTVFDEYFGDKKIVELLVKELLHPIIVENFFI